MSIFMILLLIYMAFSTVMSFYYAGAYANGKTEVREGNSIVAAYLISAFLTAIIFVGLYFGW